MKIRYYIAHFLKDQYILEDFSIRGNGDYYAVDESKFVNLNNRLLWVIGIIHTSTKKIRLEVTFERDAEKLKKIITKHVATGNCIVTDLWAGYRWIDYDGSGYVHSVIIMAMVKKVPVILNKSGHN